jgi:hypothetical protein
MGILLLEIESDEPDELEQLVNKMMEKMPAKVAAKVSHHMWLQWSEKEQDVIDLMKVIIEPLSEDYDGPQSLS